MIFHPEIIALIGTTEKEATGGRTIMENQLRPKGRRSAPVNTAFFLVLLIFISCANLLPSSKVSVKSPWNDYDSAKVDYEKIIPGMTTVAELDRLGFNPYEAPNIRILNATDIINLFMPTPSIGIENLDPGIQKCIESKDRCTAYKIEPAILDSERIGSFWLDMFSFKRDTVASGWEFRGLITIVGNVVTYKDPAGGRPKISTQEIKKNPLGPLQDIGGIIQGATPGFLR